MSYSHLLLGTALSLLFGAGFFRADRWGAQSGTLDLGSGPLRSPPALGLAAAMCPRSQCVPLPMGQACLRAEMPVSALTRGLDLEKELGSGLAGFECQP